jgi:DNA (cytosine-5)-methyltransferase 1
VVVLENVAALFTRGLDRVLGTLAEIGYDAEWHSIPAAAAGAPHIRDRVFILAYANGKGLEKRERKDTTGTRTICGAKPCRSEWWQFEPDVGRVANGVPARAHRLRGLGNAVVPQVAEWIGRRIVESVE